MEPCDFGQAEGNQTYCAEDEHAGPRPVPSPEASAPSPDETAKPPNSAKPASATVDASSSANIQSKPNSRLEGAGSTSLADEVVSHLPAMRGFARSMTRNANEADDLVQEALLRAIEHIHQFRRGTNLRAWLFTILRNCFLSQAIKRRREAPGSKDCVSALPQAVPDSQIWNIQRNEVEKALDSLPYHQREALLLVVVVGASYLEAAEILGCDIGTIKSRINRARAGLRDRLGEIFTN